MWNMLESCFTHRRSDLSVEMCIHIYWPLLIKQSKLFVLFLNPAMSPHILLTLAIWFSVWRECVCFCLNKALGFFVSFSKVKRSFLPSWTCLQLWMYFHGNKSKLLKTCVILPWFITATQHLLCLSLPCIVFFFNHSQVIYNNYESLQEQRLHLHNLAHSSIQIAHSHLHSVFLLFHFWLC